MIRHTKPETGISINQYNLYFSATIKMWASEDKVVNSVSLFTCSSVYPDWALSMIRDGSSYTQIQMRKGLL